MTALAAYEAGLGGAPVWVRSGDGRRALPVHRWAGEVDARDDGLLTAVLSGTGARPRVLDIGCGAGRLTVALLGRGAQALGVDSSPTAVRLARSRGARVHRADVLGPLPDAWRHGWDRVLLADGNLGIGGDPARLLNRLVPLLAPGGRIVADVRAGGGIARGPAWIESVDVAGDPIGGAVPWAWVGADAAAELGAACGLALSDLRPVPGARTRRWVATWGRP
ncbi:class I SAM-dependent DNA methyltransferase [Spongisporangium articulatum]|uniref:Class I SAM-dependent DNA methyltransferase n=1 Tax=Spongisporangium articulatum TaxID=3362603 RepID=A0ABW8AR86_9ACTN